MSDMGKQLSDDQFTRAMADIDSDGSGEVDFTEFLQWWQMQDPEAQNQLRLLHQVRVCDYACAQSSSQMTSML
jgi:Ca2+-binding EF-hand superfamily protein